LPRFFTTALEPREAGAQLYIMMAKLLGREAGDFSESG
jgi:hypothetical protein